MTLKIHRKSRKTMPNALPHYVLKALMMRSKVSGYSDAFWSFRSSILKFPNPQHSEFSIYPGDEIRVGREFHLEQPTFRETLKHFAIHDGRISKKHFRIYSIIYEQKKSCDGESDVLPPLVYCEDLESFNGTYVNDNLIGIIGKEKMPHLLCDGDVIEIHPNWRFTFQQSNYQMIFPTSNQSRDMEVYHDFPF
jgi:hypothetical protein